jgi:hypothetical protein
MPAHDPQDRVRIAQIAADVSWGKTPDRLARTAPARKAFDDKFLEQVPAEVTDPDARRAAAENLRRAHYRQLARRSAIVRKANAVLRKNGGQACAS